MNDKWYRYDFLKKKKELINLLNKDYNNPSIKWTLKTINDIGLKDEETEFENIKELLIEDFFIENNSRIWWVKIKELAKLKVKYIKEMSYSYYDYDSLDANFFADDFFKNGTNEEIYDIYKYIYEHNKKNIRFFNKAFGDYGGETIYLDYYHKTYIILSKLNSIEDLVCFCHEFGHAIQFNLNYNPSLENYNNVHTEIVSMFIELLSTEYFTNKYFEKDGAIYSAESIANRLVSTKDVWDEINLFKNINYNKNDYESFLKQIEILENYLGDAGAKYLLNNNPSAGYVYSVGLIVACNLFNIYMSDKDKALNLMLIIIYIDKGLSVDKYYEELEKLEITDVKQVRKYRNYVNKRVRKLI